ncbi:MAG: translation initiation factor IF-2 [Clostridiaceae bacterium]|nr:translation initiation factor IF-2 [Clostridiaceae bacterium]
MSGFITEEEALRQRKEQDAQETILDAEIPPVKETLEELPGPEASLHDGEIKDIPGSSTIDIQGISGKIIPGFIKIIKKPKAKPVEVPPLEVEKPEALPVVPVEIVAPVPTVAEASRVPEIELAPEAKKVAELPKKLDEKPVKAVAKTEPEVEFVAKAEPVTEIPVVKVPKTEKKPVKVIAEEPVKAKPGPATVERIVEEPVKIKPQSKPAESVVAEPVKIKPQPKPVQPVVDQPVSKKAPVAKIEPQRKPVEKRPLSRDDLSLAERSLPIGERATRPEPAVLPVPEKRQPLTTQDGSPLRAQRGNYVGSGRDSVPAAERSQRPRDDRRPQGGPQERSSPYGSRPPTAGAQDRSSGYGGRPQSSPSRGPRPSQPPIAPAAEPVDTNARPSSLARRNQKGRDRQRADASRDRNVRRQQEPVPMARGSRRRSRDSEQQTSQVKRPVAQLTNVTLPERLTVKDLAEAMKKTTTDVIMKLMGLGMMASINQEIDYETAEIIASEFGIESEKLIEITEEDILFDDSVDKDEDLVSRPPVVVVMGHVDHGKTSILDYIRKSSVTEGEAGGITQHIGAYSVMVNEKMITFLDTPGHEAFTTLRARGAQVTDIAILVVAADDGVMPQTIEAINHARAANTEIIVAINKIDRAEADVERVKRELSQYNLMDSNWGGQTTIVPVSALTGKNMDELLEMILLTADVLDLRANPERQAKGTVIEAKLDITRGPLATVLIQRGTLKQGDAVVVGSTVGRVRMLYNDHGQQIDQAGPSMPVEIIGLGGVPEGGDILYRVENERVARDLVGKRKTEDRDSTLLQSSRMTLDTLFVQMSDEEIIELNLIVKADAQGSVEAVRQSMEKLSTEKIRVKVIHGAVGAITESDIRLAEVANAIIIGFNVRPAATATQVAADSNVDIRLYRVIYEAIEEVERAMRGMLAPVMREVVTGHLEVRDVFHASSVGTIAGCYVTDGRVHRSDSARLLRDGVVIYETKLASLRRFKDDVREVSAGYECGLSLERFNDIKVGDQVEVYTMKEVEDNA